MRQREVQPVPLPPNLRLEDLSKEDIELIRQLRRERAVDFFGSALLGEELRNLSSETGGSFKTSVHEIAGKKYPAYSRRNGDHEVDGEA